MKWTVLESIVPWIVLLALLIGLVFWAWPVIVAWTGWRF
jgi:hypothetical protein